MLRLKGRVVAGLVLAACAASSGWYLTSRPPVEAESSLASREPERRVRLMPAARPPFELLGPASQDPRLIDTHPLEHLRDSPFGEAVRYR